MFLAGAHGQQEEGNAEHITQHHHGQVQAIVVAHHAAVQHTQHGGVGGDGQCQLAARARHHQALHGLVLFDNLDVLGNLEFLGLFAANAEVLGLILFPDADDSQQGEQNGNDDAYGSQHAEETGGAVAALIVLSEDGCEELHRAHTQQGTDGVENRKQRALLGVIGQNGLPGAGAAGLEGVADDPHCVQRHKHGVARPHHRVGNERGQAVQRQNADGHDEVADDHERAELAELAVGAVHQRTDDGVGDGVKQTHTRDHNGGKDHRQSQNLAAEGRNIRQHQNVIHVRGTVVQREQDQLIRFGAVDRVAVFGFIHKQLLLIAQKYKEISPPTAGHICCGR